MTLPTARLGGTDVHITRAGFGAWATGGSWAYGRGARDDMESIEAIRRAVDQGFNWIDTAAVYGLGYSERVVAQALQGVADRPYVFTRCGVLWDDDGAVTRVARPETIRRDAEPVRFRERPRTGPVPASGHRPAWTA